MTVLGIPVINRPDLLAACLGSIDADVTVVVIDNTGTGVLGDLAAELRPDAVIVDPPSNLGVAASWNLIISSYPQDGHWLIANADTVFAPGDLERLIAEVDTDEPRWVGVNGDWRVFGINAAAVELAGFFDPNFHPIYCEDADYEYRCTLAGVRWDFIEGLSSHVGSVCLDDHRRDNDRTYPANVAYYRAKWGGDLRGGERYDTPFDEGGAVADWTLSLKRLRDLTWTP